MSKLEAVGFKEFTRYLSTLPDHGKGCVICGKSAFRVGTAFPTNVSGEQVTISLSLPYAALNAMDEGEKGELMINNSMPTHSIFQPPHRSGNIEQRTTRCWK